LSASSRSLPPLRLYADALRHMTARQLLYRPRRLLSPRVLASGTRLRDPGAWLPLAAGLAVDRVPQSAPAPAPETTGEYSSVGCQRRFRDEPAFWRAGDDGLLFAFQLHGFAELSRYASTEPRAEHDLFWSCVIASWLEHEGSPSMPGWHPYPMSGRIAAWCSALSRGGWPVALQQQMLRSLTRQAAVLARCIEHDIGGNHVLRNATGLTFAGVCLGDARLERRGLDLLRNELPRQILADGGHEERSPAYHRGVLCDLVDIATLLGRASRPVPKWLVSAQQQMTAWERAMRGPDGRLPLLNDAWEGPSEPSSRSRDPISVLRSSGYVVLRHAGDQAILDVGLVAPAHLPPHAHADALSFVLWADGRPLITDPGSFTYSGEERRGFRGTASHNTVEVDGLDQCELWGDFRAAFMPRVELCEIENHDDVTMVVGRHDGYRRLADPVDHQRTFCWLPEDGLVVIDELRSKRHHQIRSRLHLAPGVSARDGQVGPMRLGVLGPGPPHKVRAGRYSPFIGQAVPIEVIERPLQAGPRVPVGWALLRPGARAILEGRRLVVQRADGRTLTLEVKAPPD